MDILRRNTDYAIRAMVYLAANYDKESVPTRMLADAEDISYELACKIMQRLNKAKLVKSEMGPKGGFSLNKKPSEITLGDVIKVIQGQIRINRCLARNFKCTLKVDCPVHPRLFKLQENLDSYFNNITLSDILKTGGKPKTNKKEQKK